VQRLTVGRRAATRIAAGHPWVYANEIREDLGSFERGGQVEVAGPRGDILGYGYVNPHSLIAARLLSRDTATFDTRFFADKLERADAFRQRFRPGARSYRLCFGESDELPGLVIDRYEDLFVVQSHAAGIDALTSEIVGALECQFEPAGVLLKYDGSARKLEGIGTRVEVAFGEVPELVTIELEGSRFALDLIHGQKSGFFHDQAANRARLAEWCDSARVLDLFCYTGAWSLAAARGGARAVVGVDASADAVRLATQSAELSGVAGRVRFEQADAFEDLGRRTGEAWDVVVLDPPAFVKSKKKLKKGLDGYREINRRGAALVRPGGILATSSCSRHVGREAFLEVVGRALADAGRSGRIIELGRQGADHPIHPLMPQTEYLTCVFVEL
jgi:23S rRNA (cytosine1962-C5)-methyltransferase